MKGIDLIKKLNENVREKDEFEKALDEAGIEFDMGNGDQEQLPDASGGSGFPKAGDELERLAADWYEQSGDYNEGELRDAIADELEQLEYTPDEIPAAVDKVIAIIYDDEYHPHPDEGNDDILAQQELEDFERSDEYYGDFGGDDF